MIEMTNTVPLLDLARQFHSIETEIRAAIDRVINAQSFILGPEVTAFETAVAEYLGCTDAIGVSSGTDALLIALMAVGIGAGDEVIVPSFSFFATAGVVARLGATPVFVDIDPATYNIDVAAVDAAIGPKTKAVIPVHLFGQCADMVPLMTLLKGRNIRVIEDAAQSLGADIDGIKAGRFGDIGCFSFFPTKNLGGFGDGGLVCTDDPELAERLRRLRVHGAKPKYHHEIVGGNFRLDAIQAAVLGVKLPYLDTWAASRRAHASFYDAELTRSGLGGNMIAGPARNVGTHVFNQYVIRSRYRDDLQKALHQKGIGTQIYYPEPLHVQPCFMNSSGSHASLPASEQAAAEVLALPIFPELRSDERDAVVTAVITALQEIG